MWGRKVARDSRRASSKSVLFGEIEEYHRGLKQHCGVDKSQVRYTRAVRNRIGCAIRAFVRLEWHRFTTGVSWFAAKFRIIRNAVRAYLAKPTLGLPKTTTA